MITSFPRLSPDGNSSRYPLDRPITRTILAGRARVRYAHATHDERLINERPEWSPDGNRVLFRSDARGAQRHLVAAHRHERRGCSALGGDRVTSTSKACSPQRAHPGLPGRHARRGHRVSQRGRRHHGRTRWLSIRRHRKSCRGSRPMAGGSLRDDESGRDAGSRSAIPRSGAEPRCRRWWH